MGRLHYGHAQPATFDDRTLAHLRSVIVSKFRLVESFGFTWVENGRQHSTWLHPGMLIVFEFEEAATPPLNIRWVEALRATANSSTGLRIVEEPEGD